MNLNIPLPLSTQYSPLFHIPQRVGSIPSAYSWDDAIACGFDVVQEETIYSPNVSHRFLPRALKGVWWYMVERDHENVEIGQRFLIRRNEDTHEGITYITDYISTRVERLSHWSRHKVIYQKGTLSPYPHHHDMWTNHIALEIQ
jgi:hypothetical protein